MGKKTIYSKENLAKVFVEARVKGYKDGYKKATDEVFDNVFLVFKFLLLPAIYNVKDNKKLSNKYLVELEPLVFDELQRLIDENFKNSISEIADSLKYLAEGTSINTVETLDDKSKLLIHHINALRKKLGAKELE